MRFLLIALCVSAAGFVTQARAQQPEQSGNEPKLSDLVSKAKVDCKSDLDKFCSNVKPGGGRVASCLDAHEDKLTDACKKSWTDTKASASRFIDRQDVAIRKSCGADAQKFCGEVPSGQGRILNCLDQHRDSLSKTCQDYQAKLDTQISDYLG